MKYHIKNKISRREIRKQGKKIIPLELMKNATNNRIGIDDGRNREDKTNSQDIPSAKNNCV